MKLRRLLWSALGAIRACRRDRRSLDFLAAGGAFRRAPPAIAQDERDATIAALKPPKRQRPLIAIIGINDATETTDYLMPYGILSARRRRRRRDAGNRARSRDAVPDAQGRTARDTSPSSMRSIPMAPTMSSFPP
jgi:hypothetical protein